MYIPLALFLLFLLDGVLSFTTSVFRGRSFVEREVRSFRRSNSVSIAESSSVDSSTRRSLLLTVTAVGIAIASTAPNYAHRNTEKQSTTPFLIASSNFMTSSASSPKLLSSIPDCIMWINDNCDRRFMHAVITSDYKFLYRGFFLANDPAPMMILKENPDLLDPDTYGNNELKYFQQLEELMKDDPVKPSNGHLATTSPGEAAHWGVAASIWPTQNAHFAWFENGGLFYPRSIGASIDRSEVIVDGRDCGSESLEDALIRKSCEVMVAAESYLVVPVRYNKQLRDGLISSFII